MVFTSRANGRSSGSYDGASLLIGAKYMTESGTLDKRAKSGEWMSREVIIVIVMVVLRFIFRSTSTLSEGGTAGSVCMFL